MSGPRPKVLLVGGPDVDARLDLMRCLSERFEMAAAGTDAALAPAFAAAGFRFNAYAMTRRASPVADGRSFLELLRLFRDERPNVVHTFDTKPSVWGRLAARRAGVPVIVGTLPGLGSLYASRGLWAATVRTLYEPLQALACRASDLTIFQNEDDRRDFEDRRIAVLGRSAVVPGSGVRTDVFTPDVPADRRRALRTELGVPDGAVVVTMVGRLARAKGVLDFAGAARAARAEGVPLHFLLAGAEDAGGVDALSVAELEEVRRSVTWMGPRRDIKEILAATDIFAFPSYYREGVPRVLLEAAAMALPLVAADVPGSRDVVEHGENGLLLPPRDVPALAAALATLGRDAELRRRLGAAARRRAETRFDLRHIAAEIGALYERLLASGGSAGVGRD